MKKILNEKEVETYSNDLAEIYCTVFKYNKEMKKYFIQRLNDATKII